MSKFGRVPLWVNQLGLTRDQSKIAMALYMHASRTEYEVWVSVRKLGKELGVSRSTYWRAKTVLVRAGVLCFKRGGKRVTTTCWLAVDKPFDFKVNTATDDFWEYNEFKSGEKGAPNVSKMTHADKVRMSHGMTHAMSHPMTHPKEVSMSKTAGKIIGFHKPAGSEQTIEQTSTTMVRQTDDAPSREEGRGTEPGKGKSRMLDSNGAGDEGARRAPAPPTGRRSDSAPEVSLSDFTETPKKRKGRALKDGTPGQKLLDAFCVCYRERFGLAYMPSWGRDLKLAKEMSANYSLDLIPGMLKLYFADKDPFVAKEGFPFSLFRHRVNQYAFQARRATKGRSGYKSEGATIGQRFLVEDNERETVHRVFTENGWEFETVKKAAPPKPEKVIMDEGEEFE